MLKRRCFTQASLVLAMTIGATGSVAQTSSDGKLRRVSFAVNVPATSIAVFKEFVANRLKQLGYIDGQNLSLDIRSLLGLSTENKTLSLPTSCDRSPRSSSSMEL